MEPPEQKLMALGFTAVEAKIYVFLLQESPATGYRIAQSLGMPLSNTYKAAEALQSRGALLVEEGEPRSYRAVPSDELLSRLEREFLTLRAEAADALTGLERPTPDPGVYQLHSHNQVVERARSMLARCRQVVLLDLFPEPLEELRDAIEATVARGVLVAILAYQPTELAGAEVVVEPQGMNVLHRWPGQWLNLVIDGTECLIAFLESGGSRLHQAIWSESPYISWVYHSAMAWSLTGPALEQQIFAGTPLPQLQQSARHYRRLHALEAPGYQSVMRALNASQSATPRPRRNRKGTPE
ncbi:MAG TPA: helix-turn-helix domain-containing protein [Chthonomonadaceae bacterium]|nr:helix-turn-helix domain-containing protein [Chthonomonadaceae bacterium]